MKASDRTKLTAALRDHVAKIAADLRTRMRAPGAARMAAEQLHKDERVAEDFEVWTDLLSRRAAVLWVLKSVYVRVLEDRGLLSPGRLLDSEAQQLFEKLAPNLGETAFLRWIYKDLASKDGGLPELFAPQPAEVVLPSDELSRALIAFWRHRDADTGAVWSFAEERFEGELMGDLYQELDPVVKDRFALCQTPDFVRAFILDRTLTPAIETFGADEVRLLDPACGSGHFLIDGLKRLVAATAEKHADWDRKKVVAHALERVVGIDLNDYACALGRTRLIMTAAELAGVTKLADAARFHPHVYWADGLEQVEKGKDLRGHQLDLLDPTKNEGPRAGLTPPEVRAALRVVLTPGFHAVVANPPYILESDEARKAYHREKTGTRQRYLSAYGAYSLASPFTERALQLGLKDSYFGLIVANNFMQRSFGRPLIEKVLANIDLSLIVDTSKADVLQKDTTTVMLFGRNRPPTAGVVRGVLGRRGETTSPDQPAMGLAWQSIQKNWDQPGTEDEYVSVHDLSRTTLAKHPWTLAGGGALQLREYIEGRAAFRLSERVKDFGVVSVIREDDLFLLGAAVLRRGIPQQCARLAIDGSNIRDWGIVGAQLAIFPYDEDLQVIAGSAREAVEAAMWPWRAVLRRRVAWKKTQIERGLLWFEYSMLFRERFGHRLLLFPKVATHNHFVLYADREIPIASSHLALLAADCSTEFAAHLLGALNSSVLGFWMRHVFKPKGGQSTGKKRQSEDWARRHEFDVTKMKKAPIPAGQQSRIASLSERLSALAKEGSQLRPAAVLAGHWESGALNELMSRADTRLGHIRSEMVAIQEEIDWTVYVAFGLVEENQARVPEDIEPIASEHRPFAIRLARSGLDGGTVSHWFESMAIAPASEVPEHYRKETRERIQRRLDLIGSDGRLSLLEAPEYKRKWEPIGFAAELAKSSFVWLAARVEEALQSRGKAASIPHIVGMVQDDPRFLTVAGIYQKRRDVDVTGLVTQILAVDSVPNHPAHIYTTSGLAKRGAWEEVWALQRREDEGESVPSIPIPQEYSQGSRGKTLDFQRNEHWRLRGKLDVPKERFIAFTEVPGRSGAETLYGWAGWTPLQRLKALLDIDEQLEDAGVVLADRAGLLDSAWRLLAAAGREDFAITNRLRAELQALLGANGPSREMVEEWKSRFPAPRTGRATPVADDSDDDDENDDVEEPEEAEVR